MTHYSLFATTPKGLELLLVDELQQLGAVDAKEKLAGVSFGADLETAYKACLWSRFANRILLKIAHKPAATPEELYASVKQIDWQQHIDVRATIAVTFVSSGKSAINHTLYGAQKVKDAIVDQFREKTGDRPSIDKHEPDVSVYVYVNNNIAEISIDLSGDSLHKRGYRLHAVTAPLKENLAAAILKRAGWDRVAKDKGTLLDPMCGSGTLVIEAAYMAANIAPGINREYYGFLGWKQHQPNVWRQVLDDAIAKRDKGLQSLPFIVGYDQDARAISTAFDNIERAGLTGKVHVEKRDLSEFAPNEKFTPGLVVVNPPYGERLGEIEDLKPLYTQLGNKLKQYFINWKAGVFTGNPDLGKVMGIRANKRYSMFNGAIPTQLLLFDVQEQFFIDRSPEAENRRRIQSAKKQVEADSEAVVMLVNRLKKNLKHFGRQAKRQDLSRYTVYDADLPEYAFKIEVTADKIYVYEYEAPKKINPEKVEKRRQEVLSVLPEIFSRDPESFYFEIISRED